MQNKTIVIIQLVKELSASIINDIVCIESKKRL